MRQRNVECANCGYQLQVQSMQSMPPCPNCEGPYAWEPRSGGDSKADPLPGRVAKEDPLAV